MRKILILFVALFVMNINAQDILQLKERAEFINKLQKERLNKLLPQLMEKTGIDMWVLIAREYNEDPIIKTMLPPTWLNARRTTIIVFSLDSKSKKFESVAIARYAFGDNIPSIWNKEKQPNHAIRLRADRQRRFFTDALQGSYHFIPAEDFGDVVIWRKEDLVTYHLATACDDAMDYSHVLRGDDLFAMTAPQVYIMDRLGLSPPQYAHIPVLTFADGTKLSKQTHAPALDNTMPEANIRTALDFLEQTPPATKLTVNQWIDWAVTHWRLQAVPSQLKPYVASDLD